MMTSASRPTTASRIGTICRAAAGKAAMASRFRVPQRPLEVRLDELAQRGEERDRRWFGQRQAIELVGGQPADAFDHERDPLGRRRWASDGPPRRRGRPVGACPRWAPAADADGALAVVATPEIGIAEPVVGDVDALGQLQAGRSRDVRMVLAQQRPPGQLDRLGAGIAWHAEAGVQVVCGEGRAGGHRWRRSYWRADRRSLSCMCPTGAVPGRGGAVR